MKSEIARDLAISLKNESNQEYAVAMRAYMKNKFIFLGLKSAKRREILKKTESGMDWFRDDLVQFVETCWNSDYRELHYCALDIATKRVKLLTEEDLDWIESLVIRNSWWDSVDGIAINVVGPILKANKMTQKKYTDKWSLSENIWLKRTAILYQLKYKKELNIELMELAINRANGTKEFFLNKAIGWILREYSKTNASYVRDFVSRTSLSNLSKKEALKWLNNQEKKQRLK